LFAGYFPHYDGALCVAANSAAPAWHKQLTGSIDIQSV